VPRVQHRGKCHHLHHFLVRIIRAFPQFFCLMVRSRIEP
jgi:hypothetical protein